MLEDWPGRISPTALQDITKAVQAFGCTTAQAAQALQAFGEATRVLEAKTKMPKRTSAKSQRLSA